MPVMTLSFFTISIMSETRNNNMDVRPPLIGMTLDELQGVAARGGMPRFVGKQLADWLYAKGVREFDEMINISRKNREWLAANYVVGREAPVASRKSVDGTVKYLFQVAPGRYIESVYIPDKDRATLCVSSATSRWRLSRMWCSWVWGNLLTI